MYQYRGLRNRNYQLPFIVSNQIVDTYNIYLVITPVYTMRFSYDLTIFDVNYFRLIAIKGDTTTRYLAYNHFQIFC